MVEKFSDSDASRNKYALSDYRDSLLYKWIQEELDKGDIQKALEYLKLATGPTKFQSYVEVLEQALQQRVCDPEVIVQKTREKIEEVFKMLVEEGAIGQSSHKIDPHSPIFRQN